jgi:uncharacterized membrane protein
MNRTPGTPPDWLDSAAIALSGLCLLHCLALPLVVGVLPALLPFVDGHLHAQMLIIVVPLSVVAIAIGYSRHRHTRIVIGAAAGLLLLVIGATLAHNALGIVADRVFTISGAIVLAVAHFYNGLYSRRHSCSTASD